MANSILASSTAEIMGPLPECAICLEPCTKLCHPDLCMHQFCYKCLLGWWEIKEECPVCKRAFRSIIVPRIAINETATATSNDDSDVIIVDDDSDFVVVSDSNHNQEDTSSESIINVVDTDSDVSIPPSQMVCKVGPSPSKGENRRPSKNGHSKWNKPCPKSKKRQRHVTSSSSSSSSTSSSESESTESDPDCHDMYQQRKRFKEKFKGKEKAKRKTTH